MGSHPDVVVLPATSDRWPDIALLLDGDVEQGCWCQAWRGTDRAAREAGASRSEWLRHQVATEDPPPGFVAYLDGAPAGWVGVATRATAPRLAGSRTIPAIDDRPVWVIGCFRIHVGYRRQGVARALLAGVVDAARAAGAPGVEAYPIDPGGRRVDVALAFVGLASMFDAAGFRRVLETTARSAGLPRQLVRLDFEPADG